MDTTHAGCTVSPEMSTSWTRDTFTLPPPGEYRETKLETAQMLIIYNQQLNKSGRDSVLKG